MFKTIKKIFGIGVFKKAYDNMDEWEKNKYFDVQKFKDIVCNEKFSMKNIAYVSFCIARNAVLIFNEQYPKDDRVNKIISMMDAMLNGKMSTHYIDVLTNSITEVCRHIGSLNLFDSFTMKKYIKYNSVLNAVRSIKYSIKVFDFIIKNENKTNILNDYLFPSVFYIGNAYSYSDYGIVNALCDYAKSLFDYDGKINFVPMFDEVKNESDKNI